jgi:uncharacterized protein (DUF488 family)
MAAYTPNTHPGTVFTIGHSTLPIGEFVGLLQAQGMEALADIRTVPRSRHNPQFNADALSRSLADAGIAYLPMPALGGLRRPRPDSPNTGWRNTNFRGYADYMQTPEFTAALEQLVDEARSSRLAMMCAEAVPWRCHRSLVADALNARGMQVMDIVAGSKLRAHRLTPFARVEGTKVTYPPEQQKLL